MDTIIIFEDTLKTVTVVHADKELIFKLFIFSWSIIIVIKSMFHEFNTNNFELNNNIWIWQISLTNQDNPLFYNEKEGLNNTLQLFTLYFLLVLMFWRRNKKPRWDNYIYIINQATKSYFNISDLADLYSKIKKTDSYWQTNHGMHILVVDIMRILDYFTVQDVMEKI